VEESYEVMDAIDAGDWQGLEEELGDLLLQAVFFAQMAREERRFDIGDSLDAINGKLVRRHPHVFGEGDATTPEEVKKRWDEIKDEEKREKGKPRASLLEGISRSQPALVEGMHIAKKAAAVGFDWETPEQVLDKLREELEELAEARQTGTQAELEGEIGDLLFVLVNLARFLNVDAEQALRKTNAKFRKRFAHVERGVAASGRQMQEATLEEMEALWQEAKRQP
jgi:MazG family protein